MANDNKRNTCFQYVICKYRSNLDFVAVAVFVVTVVVVAASVVAVVYSEINILKLNDFDMASL